MLPFDIVALHFLVGMCAGYGSWRCAARTGRDRSRGGDRPVPRLAGLSLSGYAGNTLSATDGWMMGALQRKLFSHNMLGQQGAGITRPTRLASCIHRNETSR